MQRSIFTLFIATLVAVGGCVGTGLRIGTSNANYGAYALSTGFMPDPAVIDVVSGGPLDAAVQVGGDCQGYVTGDPDVILRFDEMYGFLRFGVRATDGGDTTLIINDPNGNWYCADDTVGLNPMVDFADAAPGQYDIWVGSYYEGENHPAQLLVTELEDVVPN